jgi:hypothetical protein
MSFRLCYLITVKERKILNRHVEKIFVVALSPGTFCIEKSRRLDLY